MLKKKHEAGKLLATGLLLGAISFAGVLGEDGNYAYGLSVNQDDVQLTCRVYSGGNLDILSQVAYSEVLESLKRSEEAFVYYDKVRDELTVCTGRDLHEFFKERKRADVSVKSGVREVRDTAYEVGSTASAVDYAVDRVSRLARNISNRK